MFDKQRVILVATAAALSIVNFAAKAEYDPFEYFPARVIGQSSSSSGTQIPREATSYTATHRKEHLDKALQAFKVVGERLDFIPASGQAAEQIPS